MKKITIVMTIWCVFLSTVLIGQHKLEVTVTNVKETKGTILVALFNNEKDFLKKKVDSLKVKVSGNQAIVTFEKLEPGEYAVSAIHDLNDNRTLDTGFMGIPKEPYGFSNDARGRFGPASYEQAKFAVKGNTKISLKVE